MSEAPPPIVEYPRPHLEVGGKALVADAVAAYQASNRAAFVYLLCIVCYMVSNAVAKTSPAAAMVSIVIMYVCLLAFIVMAVRASITTANALGKNPTLAAIITAVLVFIPCGAIIVLVSQQQRLLKIFKQAGIKVKMMGPDKAEVAAYLSNPGIV